MLRRKKTIRALLSLVTVLLVVFIFVWHQLTVNSVVHHPQYPVQRPNGSLMTDLLQSNTITSHGIKTKWISMRLTRLASSWETARDNTRMKNNELFVYSKSIVLFPGLLSEYSAYQFAENAFKGGYVGELIQWSDLIATLHMLGHHVTITTSKKQLSQIASTSKGPVFDILFTDYLGMFGVHDADLIAMYKCRIRLLDSFGTEPLYSFRTRDYQADKNGEMFTAWGFEDMKQLLTLYPHTPDNSFLGFVMPSPSLSFLPSSPFSSSGSRVKKKNQAVLYGKEGSYILGHEHFIDVIGELVEVHATLKDPPKSLPAHVINHGVLKAPELTRLLQESKLFIGLGFPYEGPGPMEALSYGCVFIQPQFNPPHSRNNNWFFGGKPTSRGYTSQNPYLETVVGEPKVYTVDARNDNQVRRTVNRALKYGNFSSFIPYEFTQEGMLERVGSYITNQNFCNVNNLALSGTASASSVLWTHAVNEAIDGVLSKDTCYWSRLGHTHWWQVDLLYDYTVGKIKITVVFDWFIAKDWKTFINPFQVTLVDSHGNVAAKRVFTDARTFYLWENVEVKAQVVRIDMTGENQGYLVLCAVEVYGMEVEPIMWPHPSFLKVIMSQNGESCNEACTRKNLRCEPVYFRMLNRASSLQRNFHCKHIVTIETQYKDFPPAYAEQEVPSMNILPQTCVINGNSQLLGCPGSHKQFNRVCPCRPVNKEQTALPPPLPTFP